jgi:hypothetical protein
MSRRSRSLGLILTALAGSGAAVAQTADSPFTGQGLVALRRVTVETAAAAGRIDDAVILLKGGKIEAVGKEVTIPDEARVIDLAGRTVMPALIDPLAPVTFGAGGGGGGTRTITIRGRTLTLPAGPVGGGGSFARTADNLAGWDRSWRLFPRLGIGLVNLAPSGLGQGAVIRLTENEPERLVRNPEGLLGVTANADSASLDVIRQPLESIARSRGQAPPSAGPTPSSDAQPPSGLGGGGGRRRRGGGNEPEEIDLGEPTREEIEAELAKSDPTQIPGLGGPGGGLPMMGGGPDPATMALWTAIYDGKSPLLVTCRTSAGVAHLVKILDQYKNVKIILATDPDVVWQTIESLPVGRVRVILKPDIAFHPAMRTRINAARRLEEAKIPFAFTWSDNREVLERSTDGPLVPVAMLMKWGLSRKAAIEAVTVRPAEFLGIEKEVGTIEAGRDASLAVFSGDPLGADGRLMETVIEGRSVHAVRD